MACLPTIFPVTGHDSQTAKGSAFDSGVIFFFMSPLWRKEILCSSWSKKGSEPSVNGCSGVEKKKKSKCAVADDLFQHS